MDDFLNETKSFANALYNLSPYNFALLGATLGFILAYPLTIDEQNSLGNFLELTGQVILTINAQSQTLSDLNSPSIEDLVNEIKQLKSEIEKLKRKTNE